MKIVPFKIALLLKEAGYPQICGPFYDFEGDLWENPEEIHNFNHTYYAPTYFQVWLWLWREKQIAIPVDYFGQENNYWETCVPKGTNKFEYFSKRDPEEAIAMAIDHLVTHSLI